MKTCHLAAVLATLLASSITAHSEIRFLAHGHTDLALDYDQASDAWDFHVGSDTLGAEFAPDDVILKVKTAAETTVPNDPKFAFLGTAGSRVWILPQAQNEDLLYLGYGGDGIPDSVFVNNEVKVSLKSVIGPGNFFSYRVDSFGTPQVLFNSADGISSADLATVLGGGDAHLAWAFTQPGDYIVVLEAAGTIVAGNKSTSSGPVIFNFNVGAGPKILTAGHTDLAIAYSADDDAWDVHVGSDALEESYDANDAILEVEPEALTIAPTNNVKFAFLGNPGDPIWILPQAQNANILYLGYGGDDIPDGVFANNQVKVTLKDVVGPTNGNFFSYRVDGFGNPQVLFNTTDGISSNDVTTVQAGGDAHLAWAFTQPGTYAVTVEVSGTLAGANTVVTSEPVTYTFSVLKPKVLLTVEHTDLRVLYDPQGTNKLTIVARDEVHGLNLQTNEVILVVAEAAKVTLPAATPFGPEGAPLWVLPQSQDPNLLYLGLSAEAIPPSAFNGALNFRLKGVDGPGDFFLWQSSQNGFDVQMNSTDGISDADAHAQIIGSHEHFNFGFTTNGIYHVTFQVSGTLAGSTNISSAPSTFTFQVLPLPTNAPPTAEIELQTPHVSTTGDFVFDLSGAANLSVEVQASDDLNQWTTVATPAVTLSPQTITIPVDKAKSHRFFRVLQK